MVTRSGSESYHRSQEYNKLFMQEKDQGGARARRRLSGGWKRRPPGQGGPGGHNPGQGRRQQPLLSRSGFFILHFRFSQCCGAGAADFRAATNPAPIFRSVGAKSRSHLNFFSAQNDSKVYGAGVGFGTSDLRSEPEPPKNVPIVTGTVYAL